jgi:type II restriction enzyme
MEEILQKAIQCVQESQTAYCKFITANDTGSTGGHQSGYHISKSAWSLLFEEEGQKGANKDKFVTIKWQDDFETESRFIYYGVGTRNEYRITRFGKGFPFLTDDNVGDLLVLCKIGKENYQAYVLQTDDDMEDFFSGVGITASEVNQIIPNQLTETAEEKLLYCFREYISTLKVDFPTTTEMALRSRTCFLKAHGFTEDLIRRSPDKQIVEWIKAEYQLFRMLENDRYNHYIEKPFGDVEKLVTAANKILNRRKSRAGKSLEHHLDEIFGIFQLRYDTQVKTEGNKIPDFIFPGGDEYHNPQFDQDKLIFLGAKTTCKDRWRQVVNEADKIPVKHLFTLQQGVSRNQMAEMTAQGVRLVVPEENKKAFARDLRDEILSLEKFVGIVRTKQSI